MKRWVGVVVTLVSLAGCASEASDAEETAALCAGYEQHVALTEELLAPGVFDLSADELEAVLDDRRVVSRTMAEHADGELLEVLDLADQFGGTADDRLVDEFREDGARLQAVGNGWTATALGDHGDLVVDGARLAMRDWFAAGAQKAELLYVTCEAPELAGAPAQDLGDAPPDGVISYFRFTDISTNTGERRAVTVAGDESDLRYPLPAGWRSPTFADASGDRVVFSAQRGNRIGLLSYGSNGGIAEIVYDGRDSLICPSLSTSGAPILAAEQPSDGEAVEVRDGTAEDLGLDLAVQGCAADIGDDRLVMAPAATELSDPSGAAVVSRDGSDFEAIDLPARCFAVLGDVDASQQHVALSARCGTPGDSGLWTVDLETFEATHLVTGLVGTPKFSPDGEWLTYSFAPLGTRSSETAIWLANADGTGARELVERGAFPLWLPDQ